MYEKISYARTNTYTYMIVVTVFKLYEKVREKNEESA